MKVDSELDKVLGCVIGASIGGPLEMAAAERVRMEFNGTDWIDDMRPYRRSNGFTGRQMTKRLEHLFELAADVESDRMLMDVLARECEHLHVFDPVDVLCVPMAIIYRTNGHPMRSILMACNHRILTPEGEILKLRDTDCVGYVTGALVGAMQGLSALPDEWVSAVLKANRTIYGFDLVASAERFYTTIN